MVYGKNLIFDAQTGEMVEEMVDDAWILERKPNQLLLTLDKEQIRANGKDQALVTVQLVSPLLVNGRQNPVAKSDTVHLRVDDQVVALDLDQKGQATLIITSVEAGVFGIVGEEMITNELTLEVTE